MSEIIPNVIVSMPSQLFTMARSFKACSNGRIYIGKIDTDPTIPENQIQIYMERENGDLVPAPQPIIINAAGYPVYAGQMAKFVTVQGHSMAVYDSYGVQQFYLPNVLKYSPDRLRQELESEHGAELINTKFGVNLQEYLNSMYFDNVLFDASKVEDAFKTNNIILLRTADINVSIEIPVDKKLIVLPPVGSQSVVLRKEGKVFIVNKGSQLIAPYLETADYDMDVVTVNGSSRPTMLLAVGQETMVDVNIYGHYTRGRGIVMDATTGQNGKSGIISGVIIKATVRGMLTAYEEVLGRTGGEEDPTYINNNHINITIWKCTNGLMQFDYDYFKEREKYGEISGNDYKLYYQSSTESVNILRICGVYNVVTGTVWDTDYPGLHQKSVDIRGMSNVIGSKSFPSISTQFVTVDNSTSNGNTYIGATYGINRIDNGGLSVFSNASLASHDRDNIRSIESTLFFIKDEKNIIPNSNFIVGSVNLDYRFLHNLPIIADGFIVIENINGWDLANVRVGIGLGLEEGQKAISEEYKITQSGRAIKIPVSIIITKTKVKAFSGSYFWYGSPSDMPEINGRVNIILTVKADKSVIAASAHLTIKSFSL
ncbi:phage head-binding domain-containing protein [Xenorhabdus bovienii]|uniref:phage head-binding domain-containing protein n=1 Tax=Xenorhabdus bovienii TaxID=40576 RepID=UPI002157F921|nr:phage head-binding domain-containing protein [Xenorhabdus bovienii]